MENRLVEKVNEFWSKEEIQTYLTEQLNATLYEINDLPLYIKVIEIVKYADHCTSEFMQSIHTSCIRNRKVRVRNIMKPYKELFRMLDNKFLTYALYLAPTFDTYIYEILAQRSHYDRYVLTKRNFEEQIINITYFRYIQYLTYYIIIGLRLGKRLDIKILDTICDKSISQYTFGFTQVFVPILSNFNTIDQLNDMYNYIKDNQLGECSSNNIITDEVIIYRTPKHRRKIVTNYIKSRREDV